MRLLQVSLRSLLLYSIVLLLISIPVSWVSIQKMLNEEVDESISRQSEQFLRHIKNFEYLDDLETDLKVLDQLSYNIHIKPAETVTRTKSIKRLSNMTALNIAKDLSVRCPQVWLSKGNLTSLLWKCLSWITTIWLWPLAWCRLPSR